MTKRTRAPWTARCKSGYVIEGKTCQRFTPRGALMCNDCLDAEATGLYPVDEPSYLTPALIALVTYWAIVIVLAALISPQAS